MERRARRVLAGLVGLAGGLAPAVALAGEGGDHGGVATTAIFHAVNLIALVGVLVYFARGPVGKMLAERKARVTAELDEARRLHEEARQLLGQAQARIQALDGERAQILAEYKQMGEVERERIIGEATAQADKIRSDAEATVKAEIQRAQKALEAEVVQLAIGLAEQRLKERLDAGAHGRLLDVYVEDLGRQVRA